MLQSNFWEPLWQWPLSRKTKVILLKSKVGISSGFQAGLGNPNVTQASLGAWGLLKAKPSQAWGREET
jgi:hypothetical protein